MTYLICPGCGGLLWQESLACERCGNEVMYDPVGAAMVAVDASALTPCVNRSWRCNWAVPVAGEHAACYSCRLTRRRPDADDITALEKLATTATAKRRLLIGLADLGLPVVPYWVREGGLAFDLLSSHSGNGPVTIGHANGVITIDLAESLDDYRERLRIQLSEPYRTMLGHFRHEVGHYYQWQLVEIPGGEPLDECRDLFGDERLSYSDAIARHYREGAPQDWPASYLSSYATMHPWEDFAETFAHYQHILATLAIVAAGGLRMSADVLPTLEADVTARISYADRTMAEALADWSWISHLLNRANHALGKGDLYPFQIPGPVVAKLDFVHRVVQGARVDQPFVGLAAAA